MFRKKNQFELMSDADSEVNLTKELKKTKKKFRDLNYSDVVRKENKEKILKSFNLKIKRRNRRKGRKRTSVQGKDKSSKL